METKIQPKVIKDRWGFFREEALPHPLDWIIKPHRKCEEDLLDCCYVNEGDGSVEFGEVEIAALLHEYGMPPIETLRQEMDVHTLMCTEECEYICIECGYRVSSEGKWWFNPDTNKFDLGRILPYAKGLSRYERQQHEAGGQLALPLDLGEKVE